MVSVLNRKLGRQLRRSWLLLLAITSIITIGVMEFVALGSCYNNLTEAKRHYYRQCRMPDFWVDLKKVPLAELDRLAETPGVVEIRPRIQFFATVDLDGAEKPLNGLVLSLPDRRQNVLADIVLRHGGYFTDRRQNEVIVNESFARRHGLRPGDWIRLVLNNRLQELFIVGTAISSEFVYLLGPGSIVPDPENFGVFYLKQSYAEDVFDFDGAANQVLGSLAPEFRGRSKPLLAEAERMLSSYGVITTIDLEDQPSNRYLTQEIDGLKSFAFFMPTVFLTIAALVLNVLLTRLAEQERTVVGTLKALGYSDLEIFGHFLKYGLAVGLAGGLLGCLAGYWLATGVTVIYREFYEFPELHNRIYYGRSLAGLGISLACAVVGSLHGTRSVLRLRPAEAMRPKPPEQGHSVLLERIGWFWQRLSSSWRMVLRDLIRNRGRTAAGVFAAMMGASILSAGFMLAHGSFYLVDFQFHRVLRHDLELAFKDERGEDALQEAAALPGVDLAEPVFSVPCTFINGPYEYRAGITGLAAGARLTIPRDREARPIRISAAGLSMSGKLADILHLDRGDLVTVQPIVGQRREQVVRVIEIVDDYLGTSVYTEIGQLSRLMDEELAMNGVQLATSRRAADEAALYRELKEMPTLESVTARADMAASIEQTLVRNMWVFIGLLVLFAGIVFFGSILNSSLVSLAERQREVATLRVLGYGPWQIGSLMLRESFIISAIGTALGMPLGYMLTVLLAMSYDTELFRFPVVSTPGVWIGTMVLGIVFTGAAHLFVQRSIHRMDWLEALKAKE